MNKSKHFSTKELTCKCGCNTCEMNEKFMEQLENLREYLSTPLVLSSAYRCPTHPVEAVKTKGGYHTLGRAVDIKCTDSTMRFNLVLAALQMGFRGIGVSKNFIHLDNRNHGLIWLY